MSLDDVLGIVGLAIIIGGFLFLVIWLVLAFGNREQKKYDLNNEKVSLEIELLKRQLSEYEIKDSKNE